MPLDLFTNLRYTMLFQHSTNYAIITHQFPTMFKKIKIRKWKNDGIA